MTIDDFKKLSPLVAGYELRPDRAYLIVVDGKKYSQAAANSLLSDVRQMHHDLQIAVIVVEHPKAFEVKESSAAPAEHESEQ
jgi:hypothetical protein